MLSAERVGASADQIRTLAAEAAVLGLPLVLMDLVRSAHPAPNARFLRWPADRDPITPSPFGRDLDLASSSAWLDLADGPVVVTLPALHGRQAVITAHDALGGSLASLGSRVTGGMGRDIAIVGPDWRGELACGLSAVRSPTQGAWITSAIWAHGAADREVTRALEDHLFITPLFGAATAPAAAASGGAVLARPVLDDFSRMSAVAFFDRLAGVLARDPSARAGLEQLDRVGRLGVVPGRPFDGLDLAPQQLQALRQGYAAGLDLVRSAPRAGAGWRRTSIGRHDPEGAEDRAARLWTTLGAPPAEDVTSWTTASDADGRPLDGSRRYRLCFEDSGPPPAEAFWTADLLDPAGEVLANDHGRSVVSDRGFSRWSGDGAISLPIQRRRPARDAMNWLAAPKGRFGVRLQIHWPRGSVLDGRWSPPGLQDLGPARAAATVFNAGTRRRPRPWSPTTAPVAISLNGALS